MYVSVGKTYCNPLMMIFFGGVNQTRVSFPHEECAFRSHINWNTNMVPSDLHEFFNSSAGGYGSYSQPSAIWCQGETTIYQTKRQSPSARSYIVSQSNPDLQEKIGTRKPDPPSWRNFMSLILVRVKTRHFNPCLAEARKNLIEGAKTKLGD
jgi:hypothetical protein